MLQRDLEGKKAGRAPAKVPCKAPGCISRQPERLLIHALMMNLILSPAEQMMA